MLDVSDVMAGFIVLFVIVFVGPYVVDQLQPKPTPIPPTPTPDCPNPPCPDPNPNPPKPCPNPPCPDPNPNPPNPCPNPPCPDPPTPCQVQSTIADLTSDTLKTYGPSVDFNAKEVTFTSGNVIWNNSTYPAFGAFDLSMDLRWDDHVRYEYITFDVSASVDENRLNILLTQNDKKKHLNFVVSVNKQIVLSGNVDESPSASLRVTSYSESDGNKIKLVLSNQTFMSGPLPSDIGDYITGFVSLSAFVSSKKVHVSNVTFQSITPCTNTKLGSAWPRAPTSFFSLGIGETDVHYTRRRANL